MVDYLISLPERTLRVLAVFFGGLVHETVEILLPGWLRNSRIYQATIGGLLRIAIEFVGGLSGVLPPNDMHAGEFAMRKAAGTGIELAGFLAMGLSPIWLFAAAADITGGTRTYLDTLISELQRDGLLPEDADIASVQEMLNTLEGTSSQMTNMVDVPPLNVVDLRNSWNDLKQNATNLPDAGRLASLYEDLQGAANQEGCSLESVSSMIAAGAARAGVQVGQTYVFDYYQDALRFINKEGFEFYSKRVSKPYLMAASAHFDPKRLTHTERLLQRRRPRKDMINDYHSTAKKNEAPPEIVFDLLADHTKFPIWDPHFSHASLSSDGPIQKGSKGTTVGEVMGRTVESEIYYNAYDRPKFVSGGTSSGPVIAKNSVTFTPTDNGTLIDFYLEVKLKGLMRLFEMFIKPVIVKEKEETLDALDDYITKNY